MSRSRSASASPLALLRVPAYRRLWLAGGLLGTVRWLEVLGVALWTLAETGSALIVALMLFARTAPQPLLGVPIGVLADRLDRRRLLIVGVGASLSSAATLLALTLAGWLSPWQVALGAFVSGGAWTMEHPVRRALIADAVGVERIGPAISLDSATFNATRMSGPVLGGAVYAGFGLVGVYTTTIALLSVTIVSLAGLSVGRAPRSARAAERFLDALRGGLRYVRARPVLAGVMVVTVIANLFGFSYAAMVPVIGERVLALDPVAVGLLMSMEGVGALLGATTLAFLVRPAAYGRIFVGGALLFLVMVVVFSRSTHVGVSMSALFLAGLGLAGFGSMQSAILIANSAPEMRSRVMGVLVACIGAGPVGVLIVGFLGDFLGAAEALFITAICGGCGIVAAALAWPSLWREPAAGQG